MTLLPDTPIGVAWLGQTAGHGPDDGNLPLGPASRWDWDGETRYSVVSVPTEDFEAVCFLCGRVQLEMKTTRALATRRALRGFAPCTVCGGSVLLCG